MNQTAQKQIQACLNSTQLGQLAHHLLAQQTAAPTTPLTEHRARALLRATGVLDEASYGAFTRLVEKEENLRVVLYELLVQSEDGAPRPLATPTAVAPIPWLALLITLFAHKSGYPVEQLDPANPPALHTPAGLMLQQTGQFMRQQLQRSATDRDRLARKLAFNGALAPGLDELPTAAHPIAPVPPHFRTPVPVRYPEYNPPLQVGSVEEPAPPPAPSPTMPPGVQRGAPITITSADVEAARPPQTPERVARQVRVAPTQPVRRPAAGPPSPSFLESLRGLFRSESFKSTKLRILVQEYPDGPGLYGLQVRVTSKGIKSFVAGTTDREGRFLCELPVRLTSGLTYDVDVTWPRETGGDTERKSITLNADRTEFALPFYRRMAQ